MIYKTSDFDRRKLKFVICDAYKLLFGCLHQGEKGRPDTWHGLTREEICLQGCAWKK